MLIHTTMHSKPIHYKPTQYNTQYNTQHNTTIKHTTLSYSTIQPHNTTYYNIA